MQLSTLIAYIETNCTDILQVLQGGGIARDTIDTSLKVYTILNAVFPDATYPLTFPKEKFTIPGCVYSLQSSQKIAISGVDILQQDVFVVYFHTESTSTEGGFSQLVALRESVRDGFLGYGTTAEAVEIEITDESLDYIDSIDRYQCAMQVHITHLMGVNQSAPALFVIEENVNASESQYDNCFIQNKQTTLSFIIVCNLTDLEATRTSLESNIIGYGPQTGYDGLQIIQEGRVDTIGDLIVWQQRYTTDSQIR